MLTIFLKKFPVTVLIITDYIPSVIFLFKKSPPKSPLNSMNLLYIVVISYYIKKMIILAFL